MAVELYFSLFFAKLVEKRRKKLNFQGEPQVEPWFS